jgi:GTP-dependent phosphoenolpyruvate carboxykinase
MAYIINAMHYLDEKGAIGPKEGPGRQMAEFLGAVIAQATADPSQKHQVSCITCSKKVISAVDLSDRINWNCTECETKGRISDWQGTFWDLTTQATNSLGNAEEGFQK